MNIVAHVYHSHVRNPLSWAISPGVHEIIWSTDTISPDFGLSDLCHIVSCLLMTWSLMLS